MFVVRHEYATTTLHVTDTVLTDSGFSVLIELDPDLSYSTFFSALSSGAKSKTRDLAETKTWWLSKGIFFIQLFIFS